MLPKIKTTPEGEGLWFIPLGNQYPSKIKTTSLFNTKIQRTKGCLSNKVSLPNFGFSIIPEAMHQIYMGENHNKLELSCAKLNAKTCS